VFADVAAGNGMLTAESIEARLSPRTGAVLPVHLFGPQAPLEEILALAQAHGLPVVEDASQAHFSRLDGRYAGTWGDLACFSLQQSKVVSCGEGGIVVAGDAALAERARVFQNKGWIRGAPGDRAYPFVGFNYRMPELSAAVALAQLAKADTIVERRRQSMEAFREILFGVDELYVQETRPGEEVSWWSACVVFRDLRDVEHARRVELALRDVGFPFTLGYIGVSPLYMTDALQRRQSVDGTPRRYRAGDCPQAEWFLAHSLSTNWNE